MGQTVNLLSLDFGGSNPSSPTKKASFGALFLWAEMDSKMYLFLFRYAKALHYIPLGGPPGPRSRSKHSLAPIRLHLRKISVLREPMGTVLFGPQCRKKAQ